MVALLGIAVAYQAVASHRTRFFKASGCEGSAVLPAVQAAQRCFPQSTNLTRLAEHRAHAIAITQPARRVRSLRRFANRPAPSTMANPEAPSNMVVGSGTGIIPMTKSF